MPRFKLNATTGLIAAMFVAFVFAWLPGGNELTLKWLAFTGFTKPWALLTYPFASVGGGAGFTFVVFSWIWLYIVGNTIESRYQTKGFLLTFFGYAVGACLLLGSASLAMNWPLTLAGTWLPLSALTCLWAAFNPTQTVLFMMVIPVQARWIALITALSDLFMFGTGNPIIGVVAVIPCAVAWFHGQGTFHLPQKKTVAGGRGQKGQSPQEFENYIEKVRSKEKEREERERLRKLFEGSLSDGPSDPDERSGS